MMRTYSHPAIAAKLSMVSPQLGTSLLEMLMYSSCLTMFLCGVLTLYVSVTRASAAATRQIEMARTAEALKMDYTRAIREASGIAEGVGVYTNSEEQLVLRMPPLETEPGQRYIVLSRGGHGGRASLLEILDSGEKQEALRCLQYPVPVGGLHFARAGRLVTVVVDVLKPRRKAERESTPYQFCAAMRGMGDAS